MVMMQAGVDPLSPPPPRNIEFDPHLDAWVFSRYADVVAAFREPRLWPAGPRRQPNTKIPDHAVQQRLRAETLAALSAPNLAQWHGRFLEIARDLAERLASDCPVEVVHEFVQPYCLGAAEIVTGADPAHSGNLLTLATEIANSSADPLADDLRSRASAASGELARYFPRGAVPADGPTFVALARTLACLLANGWVALLRHPAEFALLREQPDLIPKAIEELLRYAALPQAMFRSAVNDLELCGVRIAAGERVILQLASANRDPAQFPDPNRLDFTRRAPAHLSLGLGPHSCVGAALIRIAAAAATTAFVRRFAGWEVCSAIVWIGGSGFRSPESVYLRDNGT